MSVRVLSWVLDEAPVEHRGDLLALLVLADHARDDGDGAYPSVATIARKARLSERGARLALRNLEAAGAIVQTGRGPAGTVSYRVVMPAASAPGSHCPPATTAPGSDFPQGGHSAAAEAAPTAPEPSLQQPSVEPSGGEARKRASLPAGDIRRVFDEWVTATERDASKTQLTPDRRRRIEKALRSHGLEDCLAAVRNIGADAWARGQNDRGRRFDDIEHALGTAERLERWRDQPPRAAQLAAAGRPASARDDLSYLDDGLQDAGAASEPHREAA